MLVLRGEAMTLRDECQCEHESHFPERKTPGHTYGAILPRVEPVFTDRGTFYCCQRCRTAGHMLPASGAMRYTTSGWMVK